MKKAIFFIASLLVLSAIAHAEPSVYPKDYLLWDNGDVMWDGSSLFYPSDGDRLSTTGWDNTGSSYDFYDDDKDKDGSMAIDLEPVSSPSSGAIKWDFGSAKSNITIHATVFEDTSDTNAYTYIQLFDSGNSQEEQVGIFSSVSNANWYKTPSQTDSGVARRERGNLTFHIAPGASYIASWLDTELLNNDTTVDAIRYFKFSTDNDGGNNRLDMQLDNIMVWDGSPEDRPQQDWVNITFYNMTSEGGLGCTNWNSDKSNACSTTDSTPTVFVKTDMDADCRIGVSDLSYSSMGESRNCTGGQGTEEHTCTLSFQDALSGGNSNVYVACDSPYAFDTATSTSGALSITLDDPSATAEEAIENGVASALSDYSLFSNQKVYSRSASNTQHISIYDRVVKWGSKIWAFNIFGDGEDPSGGQNITPVLYVLDISVNNTAADVNQSVYDLITGTK